MRPELVLSDTTESRAGYATRVTRTQRLLGIVLWCLLGAAWAYLHS